MAKVFKKRQGGGVEYVDTAFIILVVMAWVFIANAWKDPLASTMLVVSVFACSFYLVAQYTGVLKSLELTRPFWTISGLLSIPIWYITFLILPAPAGSYIAPQGIENTLVFFLGGKGTEIFVQTMFVIVESIMAGVIGGFFIGVGKERAKTRKKQEFNIIAVILMVAIFMALAHINFVVRVAQAGVYNPYILFGHQVLVFGILMIGLVLTPFGMPWLIAAHMTKTVLLVVAFGNIWAWIVLIAFYIIMDIASYYLGSKKERQSYSQMGGGKAAWIP